MPALGAGIHVFTHCGTKDVDGRDKPGHDGVDVVCYWAAEAPLRSALRAYMARSARSISSAG